MTKWFILLCCFYSGMLAAQDFSIGGKVVDHEDAPISFVNILVFKADEDSPIKGTTTDDAGAFRLKGLDEGSYKLSFSYIGFEDYHHHLEISSNLNLGNIVLKESSQMLDETVVTAKLPTVNKTPGKLVFNVENTSFSVGNTMDLLRKTPGVIVVGENIQVKLTTPIIYINGKRVYLSVSEVSALLQNLDASIVKSVEVITNPSAKYDSEAGTVLNIVTSKAISIGYKGSVNGTYLQGIYPKYSLGSSHFYKNNWLNLYASYTFRKSKEYKKDENYIRFFQPDEVLTKSIWETDFDRTTDSRNHNINAALDFTLDENNTISLSSNISISPNSDFTNNGKTNIYSPSRLLDSTSTTLSEVNYRNENMTFALDYTRALNKDGAIFTASANYIYYNNLRDQSVSSDYFLADDSFLRNSSFYTDSKQRNNIFTGKADVSTSLWGGTFSAGLKFSTIDTESELDFFDSIDNSNIFNDQRSDNFNYKENIYAEYINFEKDWDKWSITAGLRGEYTDIDAISRSLGDVNSKTYFDIFPAASLHYNINEDNGVGLSYKRSMQRPRYESLNPFKYYITENNYIGGSPDLVPAIEDKLVLSYDFKNKWFFELYYQNQKSSLDYLTIQDNASSLLKSVNANLIKSYQYSFDILFYDSLTSWWWAQISTSSYYLANEFYSLESIQETYLNDTFGQYIQAFSQFTLSKDKSFTGDLTAM
ncbi:MAG TPA: TonB-dependent receptor, partial [Aequorivita sp.]|nr:TonB-dependent receptor [Aequorivita sp.]